MMIGFIWERYFLRQFLSLFFLFLFCFYGLYVLVDYASHTSALAHHHIQIAWFEIARYYLYVFASRAEILIPIALLIAFIKTVCTLNSNQELVALMASGLKLKLLMRPFIAVGLICVFLLYVNEQFLLPDALKKLRRIEASTKPQKHRHAPPLGVHHLILEDSSLLVYQNYEGEKKRFFDAFWIQSIDSIYRIKFLSPSLETPKGFFVDHLVRQSNGELLQTAAFDELAFPDMKFNPEILQSTIIDPDILSLTTLAEEASHIAYGRTENQYKTVLNEKESQLMTALYWKLALPWLCLIAILAPAPYCVRFSRQLPVFMIYMSMLFGLIAFYMFIDAAQVVARRQVLTPFWAICGPFLALFSFFGWKFSKMQ